jgi:hypothetical protein
MGIWVYKADGTLQCGQGQEISLEEMRKELATFIGERNILAGEKRTKPGMIIDLCGAPTGKVNAYEITAEGLFLLFRGIVGPMGFEIWKWPAAETAQSTETAQSARSLLDNTVPWPWAALFAGKDADETAQKKAVLNIISSLSDVGANPTTIVELLGRPVRFYTTGDALTMDYRPERVNIEQSSSHHIVRIWFG